ncbi:benzoylformate decarboxylase [soil metagenome]
MTLVRDALLHAFAARRVELIFGNPGSTEVPLLDGLAGGRLPRYVLVLHEGIAAAAADGYAQMGDRPGVVSVHATPGVANIVGGLFLAQAHRSPVVVIAGQQDSRLLERRPFLASDLAGLVGQYTKLAVQPDRAEDVIPTVARAFDVALSRPRGPVLVAVPRDFYEAEVADRQTGYEAASPAVLSARPLTHAEAGPVADATVILRAAARPVLLSGNAVGAAGASAIAAVVELAELLAARVYSEHNATNMHFPASHRLYLGGNAHGTASVARWLEGADVVVAVGCDLFMEEHFEAAGIIPPSAAVIQIDEDPREIGRVTRVDVGLAGDLAALTRQLAGSLRSTGDDEFRARVAARADEIGADRRALDAARRIREGASTSGPPITMPRLYATLRDALPVDAIMVDEAVTMASYLHEHFPLDVPGTLLSSKQSWLGWGVGAAIGVQLAQPGRRVVAVLGDGSAAYAAQGLWTAAQLALPIVFVVLNNGGYIAVQNHLRQYGQEAARVRAYVGTDLAGIDFVDWAGAYGVVGRRVVEPKEMAEAFEWALRQEAPVLLEMMIDPDDAGLGRAPIPRP